MDASVVRKANLSNEEMVGLIHASMPPTCFEKDKPALHPLTGFVPKDKDTSKQEEARKLVKESFNRMRNSNLSNSLAGSLGSGSVSLPVKAELEGKIETLQQRLDELEKKLNELSQRPNSTAPTDASIKIVYSNCRFNEPTPATQ